MIISAHRHNIDIYLRNPFFLIRANFGFFKGKRKGNLGLVAFPIAAFRGAKPLYPRPKGKTFPRHG